MQARFAIAAVMTAMAVWMLPVAAQGAGVSSDWGNQVDRPWPGENYWANPVKDWRVRDGSLVCVNVQRDRNVHLLTHQLAEGDGDLRMSVVVERDGGAEGLANAARIGFRVGVQGRLEDYRNAVIHGRGGLDAGLMRGGRLFIGGPGQGLSDPVDWSGGEVELRLVAEPETNGYTLRLSAHDPESGDELQSLSREGVGGDRFVGNIALICDGRGDNSGEIGFSEWAVAGEKVEAHEDRAFGPVFFAMHTLSRGIMKMTAQMAPLGTADNREVELQIRPADGGGWKTIDTAELHRYARTATFRVEDWDDGRDVPYRVRYELKRADGSADAYHYTGTVRKDPVEKDEIEIAGFTGHKDMLFPNTHVVRNVAHHDPDVLVFTGDQYYEDSGGYGIERSGSMERLSLDLMQHWVLLGWSFGDLMRDRPTLNLTDDHDVYQGNIWGAAGRNIDSYDEHPYGGYLMPAQWVNIVERCQTSHMPDPYDPTPVKQNIGVYYTDMLYGRVSFAVLEDRKFKSGPAGLVPETESGRPDHVVREDFDPETVDLPEAKLLGDRQLEFLDDWAADWRGTDMKVAVSQTLFAQVPNIHGGNKKRLVADLDSNAWPQTPRDRALQKLRKGFAFHLSGDQHLPMIVHYGINEYGDAPWTICVPSIGAGYPRAFRPDEPGENRKEGMPRYTGQFRDGLGNKMTVWAVANPAEEYRSGLLKRQHDKASGYGIVRMKKPSREITMECWKLLQHPAEDGEDGMFKGWPKTISMMSNYGRTPRAHLPRIEVEGMDEPVVQVIREHNDEHGQKIVYTLRITGGSFRPMVFKDGYSYTVRIGEPGTDRMKTLKGIMPAGEDADPIEVSF